MPFSALEEVKLKSELRKFIQNKFLVEGTNMVGDDESFLEKGIIDSTGVLELVGHLEDTYGITIDDTELMPDNLDSFNRMAGFVLKKRN